MPASRARNLSDVLDYSLSLLFFGISFGVIAIAYALLSDVMWSMLTLHDFIDPSPELEAEVSEFSHSWVFYFVEMLVARPWIALSVGAVTGVPYGYWIVQNGRERFDSDVERICQRARGTKIRESWRREIATWGQVAYLCLVIGLSLLLPFSVKAELWAFACTAMLTVYPRQRRLYREAHRRLSVLASQGESVKSITRWRRNEKIGAAACIIVLVIVVGWISNLIAGFVPEMREFARDHEQFIAEMHEKYPPHTEP